MATPVLKNQIIAFLKEQHYWLQHAGHRILEGALVDDSFAKECYEIFLENSNLKKATIQRNEIVFNATPVVETPGGPQLQLEMISDIDGVNALAAKQSIQINPNLTVIYGSNGAGKSGYTRLLNKAFHGRGDKTILKNVYSTEPQNEPACDFTFNFSTGKNTLKFPAQADRAEFSSFSIFDTTCVKAHLEPDNKLNFTPNGFDFFEKLLELFERLKVLVNADIAAHKKPNDFVNLFTREGIYKDTVANLSATTKEVDIKKLSGYSEADKKQLETLITQKEDLKRLDIPKKIAGLEILGTHLKSFKDNWLTINAKLSAPGTDVYKAVINSFASFTELASSEGIKNFEGKEIEQIGSPAWRNFIKAAKDYVSVVDSKKEPNGQYPAEKDNCVFCLQPLGLKERELINAYWLLLKGHAETELAKVAKQIKDHEKDLQTLRFEKFDESNTLYIHIKSINEGLAKKWKTLNETAEVLKNDLVKNLSAKNWDRQISALSIDLTELDSLAENIKADIAELVAKNPASEISLIENKIAVNGEKVLFTKLEDKILEFVRSYKWAQSATKAAGAFKTNSLTTTQGALFNQHISEKYTALFAEECKKMNASNAVKISQRNTRGITLRSLQIQGQAANRVLSEGEQKVICLADFFTESQLNPMNRGMIFDDPVNSLDHVRKSKIAERLVQLSSAKQIIIFTHDLVFVYYLKKFVEVQKTGFQCHWIENIDQPGIISNNNSPATEKDYKNLNRAEAALALAKKAAPEERESILKQAFASLRTNYEYFVIYDLFGQVVLRFEERVSIDRLKDAFITPALTAKIIEKVGLLSRYIEAHLHSDECVDIKPTPADLENEISEFKKLKEEFKTEKGKVQKAA